MIVLKKDANGIFSNFLRILDWYCYKEYTNEEIFIDWNFNDLDLLSLVFDYSKPENLENIKLNTNNWVKHSNFTIDINYNNFINKIPFYEKYNGYFYTTPEIYKEKDFQILRDEWNYIFNKNLKFKESFIKDNKNKKIVSDKKTLGVHLRSPQHYCHNRHNGPQLSIDTSIFYSEQAKYVKEYFENNQYEQVYVACDIVEFINYIKLYIPEDKILYHNYSRGTGNMDWREKPNFSHNEEIINCFTDVYNLSMCDELIMSTSNIVFGILMINNKIKYNFFPNLENFHGM